VTSRQSCMRIQEARPTRLPFIVLLAMLFGCGDGSDNQSSQEDPTQAIKEQFAEIENAKVNPVTPEQVSEAFALGSDYTDLQRDILKKELVGSVVEWRLQVYEVDLSEGRYNITSQPIPIKSKKAVQLLRASVFVVPAGDNDHDLMRKVKTNDMITIRGRVRDIVLRTVVVIEPAFLVTIPRSAL
jgi:hypothetical protein